MSFAYLEASLNAAAVGQLGNATLRWAGGGTAAVVFDARYVDALGMATNQPRLRALSTDVADLAIGAAVTVDGVAYTLQAVEDDGTGLVTLILRAA